MLAVNLTLVRQRLSYCLIPKILNARVNFFRISSGSDIVVVSKKGCTERKKERKKKEKEKERRKKKRKKERKKERKRRKKERKKERERKKEIINDTETLYTWQNCSMHTIYKHMHTQSCAHKDAKNKCELDSVL